MLCDACALNTVSDAISLPTERPPPSFSPIVCARPFVHFYIVRLVLHLHTHTHTHVYRPIRRVCRMYNAHKICIRFVQLNSSSFGLERLLCRPRDDVGFADDGFARTSKCRRTVGGYGCMGDFSTQGVPAYCVENQVECRKRWSDDVRGSTFEQGGAFLSPFLCASLRGCGNKVGEGMR